MQKNEWFFAIEYSFLLFLYLSVTIMTTFVQLLKMNGTWEKGNMSIVMKGMDHGKNRPTFVCTGNNPSHVITCFAFLFTSMLFYTFTLRGDNRKQKTWSEWQKYKHVLADFFNWLSSTELQLTNWYFPFHLKQILPADIWFNSTLQRSTSLSVHAGS